MQWLAWSPVQDSVTVACLSFFTLSSIGLMCLNASSISSVWWYTAVSMDVLLSNILQCSVFQMLQWPPGNICILPLVISWRYCLTASVHTVVGLLLSLWRGMYYRHSYVIWMSLLLLLDDFWCILCSRSTDVLSALEAFATKRYQINILHYITHTLTSTVIFCDYMCRCFFTVQNLVAVS